jgi:orotate phosphoribosyltransferase
MILSYEQRQQHWDWCREYIDRECIYRVDDSHPPIPDKVGGTYVWQFYLRRAMFNPHFAHRIGLLFWDHFLPIYEQQPFQVAACEPSGPPIGSAIQAAATRLDLPLNLFLVRREHKSFGTDNWFDGRVLPELPVLIVDDIAASSPFMLNASVRIQVKLGLPLHRNYFTVLNKVGRGFRKQAQHTENYLDGQLISLFTVNNFCCDVEQFRDRYGEGPKWTGIVK